MPAFVEGTIELDVPKKQIDKFLKNPPKGLEIKKNGEFRLIEGHTIEGIFAVSDTNAFSPLKGMQHIRITITKKPWFATVGMIEKEIKKFLENSDG